VNVGIYNVNTIFILKCRIGAFPCRDAAAARTKCDRCFFDPCCAEAVEEVGLTCYLAVLEIGIAKFADVYLV